MDDNFNKLIDSLTENISDNASYKDLSTEELRNIFNEQFNEGMDSSVIGSNVSAVLLFKLYKSFKLKGDINTKVNIISDMIFVATVAILFKR